MSQVSSELKKNILEAVAYVRENTSLTPEVAIILGSGLSHLADKIEKEASLPYWKIPHFPVSTVPGHPGRLILGHLSGRPVVVMQGRFHYYEGYSMQEVTFGVRVMKFLGAHTLVVSNAAGGVNPDFRPGDLMLIRDHINLMPENPLRGPNDESLGPRFPSMHNAYDRALRERVQSLADRLKIPLVEGVYVGLQGPNLETPAEYRMVRILGGDAVGMSTVPEVIVANHMGMRVVGFSVITNVPDFESPRETTHEEVMEVARIAGERLSRLVAELLKELS